MFRPGMASRYVPVVSRFVVRGMVVREDKPAAQVMPITAQIVADLRRCLGVKFVDVAIKAGQQARREHQRRVDQVGRPQADAWLAQQSFPLGRFWAQEGGHTVGIQRGGA